ncbi:hypothetical protein ACVWWG_009076 [Bradyrhizobium sp. LB7.2]|jgi:hypothetical protein|uniref:hypothetical protein n=1 Tax=Bradyrhizobium sp. LB14.3 TaxID=3156328 RepID=UPI003396F86E
MSKDQQAGPLRVHHHQPGPSCSKCETSTHYLTSILDVQRDRPVLIYRCDGCREEVWV